MEPRPRAPSIAQTLAARIRDPLWVLTRQWQFAEFQGEDAASPAYIELSARLTSLAGWSPEGQAVQGLTGIVPPPLEELVESEPFTADFATRVELGQVFETLLTQAGVPELVAAFRTAYPISLVLNQQVDFLFVIVSTLQTETDLDSGIALPQALSEEFEPKGVALSTNCTIWVKEKGNEWMLTDNDTGQNYAVRKESSTFKVYRLRDKEAVQFLRVCAGRAIDGVELYQAYQGSAFSLPGSVTANKVAPTTAALNNLKTWIQELFGDLGQQDPPAWKPDRLEYGVEVFGTTERTSGTTKIKENNRLSAYPGRDGDFDWHAFDLSEDQVTVNGVSPGAVDEKYMSVLPMHVRFRGMPNPRWWDFETSATDFGNIRPDKRDVAKLIIMDFMLVAGNDWFVIPFDQPVGTLCWTDSLLVHDVFGGMTLIKRAEQMDATRGPAAQGERWTMFSISRKDKPADVGDFFLLPLSASTATQTGPTLEDVRFLRDEMANMVWAVENTIENGIGQPWLGRERDLAAKPALAATPAAIGLGEENKPPLRYQIQTTVPVNWIPFLAIGIDPAAGRYALEISAMPDSFAQPILPVGRILQPTSLLTNEPYQIREEEVSREGTQLLRVVCRSRWIDGSTYLWIGRRKQTGRGEGSSGLRFDIIEPA